MNKLYKIEISHRTIIFTIFFLIFLKLLWEVRDLLFSLFFAFIIMSALKPAVYFLEKRKIPRIFSALVIFILFIFIIGYILTWVFPPLISELVQLFKQLPIIIKRLSPEFGRYLDLDNFSQFLPNLTRNIFSIVGNIFSNAIFVISTLFFSFYFILEESFIRKFLSRFFEDRHVEKVSNIFGKVEKRMSSWFWGELALMTIIGVLTFVGLSSIGVRYALPLAVIAGLLEAVPNLGPTISSVPAFLVAVSHSYFLGFSVLALYFIIQQLENNLIVPIIMRRVVGINPIITLVALIMGGRIAGVLGIVLAIPITLFIEMLIVELAQTKYEQSEVAVKPR